MKLNNIGYLLKEGFRGIFQHGFMSFAAVCMIVACLLIMGSFSLVAINADGEDFMAHFDAGCGTAVDLITGEKHDFGGGSLLPAYSAYFWLMEN